MDFLRTIKFTAAALLLILVLAAFARKNNEAQNLTEKYKCLVQLSNYQGEGAYVVVSLINPQGNYEKTLYMFGPEKRWWEEFTTWWSFFQESGGDLDAITGESIAGGERKIVTIAIAKDKFNNGYHLRFESSVEDQDYFDKDIELPLQKENLRKKMKGSGYIRYVRLIPKNN